MELVRHLLPVAVAHVYLRSDGPHVIYVSSCWGRTGWGGFKDCRGGRRVVEVGDAEESDKGSGGLFQVSSCLITCGQSYG
eukprot:1471826-Pyramimonas_sp.AAC.1